MSAVRTRFAPSPTGHLHIGGARTALFNFLYARHCGGIFVLRIEDTDRERSTDESRKAVLDSLSWLGLTWDEGPFLQSERIDLYRERAKELLDHGLAYRCCCTSEDLETKRKSALAAGRKPMYDGTCRDQGIGADSARPFVIRFRSPATGETMVDDLVKGCVVFQNVELDDLIIIRSDGTPTYNFCAVVDDADMRITHIIRGDDHLSNTPRQVLIYQALRLPVPRFAHVPLILGTDRARLSKRHGAVSVASYRDEGYLPEALVNYLARLGWSLGDQEVFTLAEMVEGFTVEDVGKAAGIFNPEKLLWLNAHYLKQRAPAQLAREVVPFVTAAGLAAPADLEWFAKVVALLQPRAKTLAEVAQMARYFLTDEIAIDDRAAEKLLTPTVVPALTDLAAGLDATEPWTHDTIHYAFKQVLAAHGLGLGKLAQPTRVAVTGGTTSPGIFEVLDLLGKPRTLQRLRAAIVRATPAATASPA
jgi:glutamyl-tRNA synthetase